MARLWQVNHLTLDPADLAHSALSAPFWNQLADPANVAHQGFVRHGGVAQAVGHVPEAYKPPYPEHVRGYLTGRGDAAGEQPRALLALGSRNSFQNLLLPAWKHDAAPRLLARDDEPWRSEHAVYYAFGRERGGAHRFEMARFEGDAPAAAAPRVVNATTPADWDYLVTGQPLVWNGELTAPPLQAALSYDLRHVWHLLWEAWQQKRWPAFAHHKAIHDELMQAFMANLSAPASERAAALLQIASRRRLEPTEDYLHSSIGQRGDGALVLVIQHGTFADLGRAHQRLGSQRAILLDNGGSVGWAYYARRAWKKGGWSGSDAAGHALPEPVFLGNGSYFRPRGHALLVFELTGDLEEPPFVPRQPTWPA